MYFNAIRENKILAKIIEFTVNGFTYDRVFLGTQNSVIQGLNTVCMEPSGSVVECLTRDRRATGWRLTSITKLCPWARHINPCLVLVQPRKTRSDITERLLTGT